MACVCDGPSAKGGELPDGSDGFRNLLKAFVFGTLQELRNIQKDDQAALQFADTGNVAGFAVGKNTSGSLYIRWRDFEHLGSRVYDEADKFVFEFDDENAVFLVSLNLRLAKALAQIHYRNDFAAKINHSLNEIRC